jgi:hypothetical protein
MCSVDQWHSPAFKWRKFLRIALVGGCYTICPSTTDLGRKFLHVALIVDHSEAPILPPLYPLTVLLVLTTISL